MRLAGRRRLSSLGILMSLLAAILMAALPASEGWAQTLPQVPPPPPPKSPPPPVKPPVTPPVKPPVRPPVTPPKPPVSVGEGTLTVAVVDATGKPEANAQVVATRAAVPSKSKVPSSKPARESGVTGPDGKVTFAKIDAGTWQLTVTTKDRETGRGTATVTPNGAAHATVRVAAVGKPKPPVRPPIKPPVKPPVTPPVKPPTAAGEGTLTVAVVDATGKPEANAQVVATGAPARTKTGLAKPARESGVTGPDGKVTFAKIDAGTWQLTVTTKDRETGRGTATVTPNGAAHATVRVAAVGKPKPPVRPPTPPRP